MEEIILLGGGRHCASVIDSTRSQGIYKPIAILDVPDKVGSEILGIPIIGTDEEMDSYFSKGIKNAFITIGSIGNTSIRENLYEQASKVGYVFPNIVDQTAIIGGKVVLGNGVFVGKGTILNTNVRIGNHSIINSGPIIEHDCMIGDFVHIAPGTTFSGGVTVGNKTHLGTNSTVIQEINIGNDTLIGAGSVVLKDIGDNKKAYGNPCKEIVN